STLFLLILTIYYLLSFYLRHLYSFPTRRSSDLVPASSSFPSSSTLVNLFSDSFIFSFFISFIGTQLSLLYWINSSASSSLLPHEAITNKVNIVSIKNIRFLIHIQSYIR